MEENETRLKEIYIEKQLLRTKIENEIEIK